MTSPPQPFDGRISQDREAEWFDRLEFPVVDPEQPVRYRNQKILGSVVRAAIGADDTPRRHTVTIGFYSLDGDPIPADAQDDIFVPVACHIEQVTIQADQACTAEVDLWAKVAEADDPPTVANTIAATSLPATDASDFSSQTVFTDWTVDLAAQTWLRLNLNSNDAARRLVVSVVLVED